MLHGIEWASGIIEGECSIFCGRGKKTTWPRYNLSVKMTDLDVLETLQSIFKVGKIYKPKKQLPHYKQPYVWIVGKKQEVKTLLILLMPYLHSRRKEQFQKALDFILSVTTAEGATQNSLAGEHGYNDEVAANREIIG